MFARTDRLLLRPGFIEDAPELARAIGDEAVVRNLARAPWPYGEAQARDFLAREPHATLPDFLILKRTGGNPRIIGGIGIDAGASRHELGYWIARPYWGLGFATEAGHAVLRMARTLRLPRLSAGHFDDNPASGAVLRKLGFRPTGRIVPRRCVARGQDVLLVEHEQADDAIPAMTGKRGRVSPDEDFRSDLRLMAA